MEVVGWGTCAKGDGWGHIRIEKEKVREEVRRKKIIK
jgi:hypothetical protein